MKIYEVKKYNNFPCKTVKSFIVNQIGNYKYMLVNRLSPMN